MCRAETTVTPSGTISCACWAADPCQTPSERVALPLTAAASGTVQSTSSWPGRSDSRRLLRFSDWARNGTVRKTTSARPAASSLTRPSTSALGTRSFSFAAASAARSGEREPITIEAPAVAQRKRQPGAQRTGAADDRDRLLGVRHRAGSLGTDPHMLREL